jgi:hypothetical protein
VNETVCWAPMVGWPAAFVPKVWQGRRDWNENGPGAPPGAAQQPAPVRLGQVYAWQGPRLVCVTCPNER